MVSIINRVKRNFKKLSDNQIISDLFKEALESISQDRDYKDKNLRKRCWVNIYDEINKCYDNVSEPLPFLAVSEISSYTKEDFKNHLETLEEKYGSSYIDNPEDKYSDDLYSLKTLYEIICINDIGDQEKIENCIRIKEKKYIYFSETLKLLIINVFFLNDLDIYVIYSETRKRFFEGKYLSNISDEEILEELKDVKKYM